MTKKSKTYTPDFIIEKMKEHDTKRKRDKRKDLLVDVLLMSLILAAVGLFVTALLVTR